MMSLVVAAVVVVAVACCPAVDAAVDAAENGLLTSESCSRTGPRMPRRRGTADARQQTSAVGNPAAGTTARRTCTLPGDGVEVSQRA